MKFGILAAYLTVLLSQKKASGQSFPPYSQQCQDDAGPPFVDDSETFGSDGRFHDNSEAWPVLVGPNGDQCPTPLANACATRGDAKTAYLEGPIDCNGNGWHCRILQDENFNGGILNTDLNFVYCNRTDETPDEGHCHGSADESTYYWWVRDHWFRQYNGRLRCCCNWESGDDPLTTGFLTNRCDYRRVVTSDENVDNCRDANEDHGLGFEGGCSNNVQIGQPIPEDDSKCWEVQHFGFVEGGGTPPPYPPVGPPPPPPPPPQTEAPVPPSTPAPVPSPTTPSPIPAQPTPAPVPLPTTPSPIPAQPTPGSCEDDEASYIEEKYAPVTGQVKFFAGGGLTGVTGCLNFAVIAVIIIVLRGRSVSTKNPLNSGEEKEIVIGQQQLGATSGLKEEGLIGFVTIVVNHVICVEDHF
eukprot:CAMPEP_0195292096 /NCGR_PEP_ID=MMETSP0707-20130614/8610_1 /TAXON_ID=33640 /ORGANISM="Asterionellopsis glacialis, Strain CCMP134" /LENGTH=412 /DNA_ID=CAMNT_0040352487 /DNA_START=50 /DNA_END=1289 /DNA_ORIENTATION=+